MSNEVVTTERTRREISAVLDPIPLLDTARFEHMQRVATIMAHASLIPESLKGSTPQATLGNCFLVVNQATRWQMDPFAVAQCMSVVQGKPCYEGKLIAAVIEVKLGIELKYTWTGEEDSDAFKIRIEHPDSPGKYVEGTVGEWKTKQWAPRGTRKRLKYRGDREWCRMWAPALLLGCYSDDEMEDLVADARARRATPVGPGLAARLAASAPSPSDTGFSADGVAREIAGETVDAETGEIANSKPAASNCQANQGAASQENDTPQTEPSTETASGLSTGQGDENSPTESKIAADPPVPTSLVGNDASSGDRAAGQDGSATPPDGAPVYNYGDYHRALSRASQPKSLTSFDQQFRNKAAWTTSDDALPVLREIFALHRKKLRGEVKPEQFVTELKKLGAV